MRSATPAPVCWPPKVFQAQQESSVPVPASWHDNRRATIDSHRAAATFLPHPSVPPQDVVGRRTQAPPTPSPPAACALRQTSPGVSDGRCGDDGGGWREGGGRGERGGGSFLCFCSPAWRPETQGQYLQLVAVVVFMIAAKLTPRSAGNAALA